jgi:hypothetical protein
MDCNPEFNIYKNVLENNDRFDKPMLDAVQTVMNNNSYIQSTIKQDSADCRFCNKHIDRSYSEYSFNNTKYIKYSESGNGSIMMTHAKFLKMKELSKCFGCCD